MGYQWQALVDTGAEFSGMSRELFDKEAKHLVTSKRSGSDGVAANQEIIAVDFEVLLDLKIGEAIYRM